MILRNAEEGRIQYRNCVFIDSPPDRIEKDGVVIERLKFDDPKKH